MNAFALWTRGGLRGFLVPMTLAVLLGSLNSCDRSTPNVVISNAPAAAPLLVEPSNQTARPSVPPKDDIEAMLVAQRKRTPAEIERAVYWNESPVLRWNEIARGLVSKYYTSPPNASRVYAYLSVAQHDALVAVTRLHAVHRRPTPPEVDSRIQPVLTTRVDATYPSDHAAIAAASAAVLASLYPNKNERESLIELAREHAQSRIIAGVSLPSDIAAGEEIGRAVAEAIIQRAGNDGSKREIPWRGTIPAGKGIWYSSETPPVEPTRPEWRKVRPWFLASSDQFRPTAPPDIDSPEYKKDLEEIQTIARQRTPEQLRIALFWADGAGTSTPPGHWNQVAADLIHERILGQMEAARIMAYLNMAMMDAGTACWEAKYHYWLLRPSQADPTISLPIGLPNFPAYPSGHSTFSAAAAEVLAYFFPDMKAKLWAMAEEASISRVYGGIHYKFDGVAGLELGGKIGRLAIEQLQSGSAITR